ncbi:hypothetical protein [Sessilibacter corallicola]|uniref:hypothetical protein n=1 Tax=Sessilibacter corallicola TaxID=2904075 RepID=UPI001E4180F5|nr:hypothetical protein [Sessilibacter corallicola]MCE2029248.1 hypothetical protein [Sessilibacter corallicola]
MKQGQVLEQQADGVFIPVTNCEIEPDLDTSLAHLAWIGVQATEILSLNNNDYSKVDFEAFTNNITFDERKTLNNWCDNKKIKRLPCTANEKEMIKLNFQHRESWARQKQVVEKKFIDRYAMSLIRVYQELDNRYADSSFDNDSLPDCILMDRIYLSISSSLKK